MIDFVRSLHVPAVTTLHTVLPDPSDSQRSILSELVARSAATVVMSRSAASLLADAYGVDEGRLDVIPHGVPNLPLVEPETVKASLGVAGRDVILSFGLLGPGKGYELVARGTARGRGGEPGSVLRHGRSHPPGPDPNGGRGLSPAPRGPGEQAWGCKGTSGSSTDSSAASS